MIFRSPEPDVVIPEVALTPFVLERASARGDKPAFIDGPTGRTLTYAGLVEAINGTAAGLAAQGFRKGNVLAIYSPNLPEYAVAFHAVSLLGGDCHHNQSVLHAGRAEPAARGRWRERARNGPCMPGQGQPRGSRRRGP